MSRESVLSSLIQFDVPVAQLKAELGTLTWDCAPVVTLLRSHIAAVLDRYSRGEIDAPTVEDWANLVECREDIGFEAGFEELIDAAIFDLANPILNGELSAVAPVILARLR
ncbi:hypothetical protein TSA1_36995 [Bradyrhizobium nitroreducens]|uniref:Uncharacterized protein n=1 Tax=Bradyrhizobium nitroreducens TaxID=709803 RepID=A0A2M6UMC3_9BRAD|nr:MULTISPECIES: hypothetical protein [Bradyrhizobium]PIT05709.1 hypothetical protein TSA1_36995 [Bradyrhizobium nitroreducens]TQF37865.1 hypothetical protein UNPF46_18010 [Bradyrhizobium sp. UNPF46]